MSLNKIQIHFRKSLPDSNETKLQACQMKNIFPPLKFQDKTENKFRSRYVNPKSKESNLQKVSWYPITRQVLSSLNTEPSSKLNINKFPFSLLNIHIHCLK
ncbi:LOW QUALITY PROTEIN: hypothetical protein PanWU01x14_311430 [Parasponia andersonii]|uniref:Uncharacterized protein n=1 Tax=Parasponia andersonii TaxID=3476 RepID=A0A2P5AQ32_PARAD|nr:LOW QUALITY PROTEIN: hypothetical protein PanWU01x14_311430 [Parasponia andersonii]